MLSNLRERLGTKYRAWSGSRREKRRDPADFTEDTKDHREGQEQRMKGRETKLNMIAEELPDHGAQSPRSSNELRKPLRMSTAKSVRYSTKPVKAGEAERSQANTRTLTLSKRLEIYVDGPFGSPSSNIYRAEHAVLIGTGIGEWRIIRAN